MINGGRLKGQDDWTRDRGKAGDYIATTGLQMQLIRGIGISQVVYVYQGFMTLRRLGQKLDSGTKLMLFSKGVLSPIVYKISTEL